MPSYSRCDAVIFLKIILTFESYTLKIELVKYDA
jgi:hypothetical protein